MSITSMTPHAVCLFVPLHKGKPSLCPAVCSVTRNQVFRVNNLRHTPAFFFLVAIRTSSLETDRDTHLRCRQFLFLFLGFLSPQHARVLTSLRFMVSPVRVKPAPSTMPNREGIVLISQERNFVRSYVQLKNIYLRKKDETRSKRSDIPHNSRNNAKALFPI